MMDKKMLLATYNKLTVAEQVITELEAYHVDPRNVLLSFVKEHISDNETTKELNGEVLVTAIVSEDVVDFLIPVLKSYHPIELHIRDLKWHSKFTSEGNQEG